MSERTILLVVFAVSCVVAASLVSARSSRLPHASPSATASAPPQGTASPPTGGVTASPSFVSASAPATTAAAGPGTSAGTLARVAPVPDCPRDMVLVEGWWCPFVAHRCARERGGRTAGSPDICDEFRSEVLCEGALEWQRICVDAFEYPNVAGMLPAVLATFDEASSACEAEGKRLCSPREWTFACEGERMVPYPTGVVRERERCRWDRPGEGVVVPSQGPTVGEQLSRIDRRSPSGSHPRCTSPFGVVDLAGNVAEWVHDPNGSKASPPFASVVVGGAWGSSPSTCRAHDTSTPPNHRAATLGFRCCVDAAPRTKPVPEPWERRGGFRPIRDAAAAALP